MMEFESLVEYLEVTLNNKSLNNSFDIDANSR